MTCFFFYYLKVDLYASLSGQVADDKKPKISRMKAKIIYFEAANYGTKKIKNLFLEKILEKFSIFELE